MLQTSLQTGSAYRRVTLLQTVSGPASLDDDEPTAPVLVLDRLLHHSSRAQLNLSRRRTHIVFIVRDPKHYERLASQLLTRFGPLVDLPVRVEVRHGDAARDSLPVLT